MALWLISSKFKMFFSPWSWFYRFSSGSEILSTRSAMIALHFANCELERSDKPELFFGYSTWFTEESERYYSILSERLVVSFLNYSGVFSSDIKTGVTCFLSANFVSSSTFTKGLFCFMLKIFLLSFSVLARSYKISAISLYFLSKRFLFSSSSCIC